MPRVGYRLTDKKEKRFDMEKLGVRLREKNIELVRIDLSQSLEEQGPFDIIVHKVTDVLGRAEGGHTKDQLYAKNFADFTRNHPECILVDPLENVIKLMSRYEQYRRVQQMDLSSPGYEVFVPTFVALGTKDVEENSKILKDACMDFPFMTKPLVSQGESLSHEMAIIFNKEGMKDIRPPCVAQSFINHNAVLYKVYVVGDEQFVCERPSLKNLTAGDDKTIFFHSSEVSTPNSSHYLNEMDESEMVNFPVKPNITKLKELGQQIRSQLQLGLFGVDVIIECGTNRYAIIDINLFPGYKEIHGFFDSFERYILQLLESKKADKSIAENKRGQCSDSSITISHNNHKRLKVQDAPPDSEDSRQTIITDNNSRMSAMSMDSSSQNGHKDLLLNDRTLISNVNNNNNNGNNNNLKEKNIHQNSYQRSSSATIVGSHGGAAAASITNISNSNNKNVNNRNSSNSVQAADSIPAVNGFT